MAEIGVKKSAPRYDAAAQHVTGGRFTGQTKARRTAPKGVYEKPVEKAQVLDNATVRADKKSEFGPIFVSTIGGGAVGSAFGVVGTLVGGVIGGVLGAVSEGFVTVGRKR